MARDFEHQPVMLAEVVETFADVLEVADMVICGHDNIEVLSRRWM